MAIFESYTFTQPYFKYIENLEYNVIPGTVTLTFDSPPSSAPGDYTGAAMQGVLMYTENLFFQQYDNTLSISGNTATLTLPINMDSNCYIQLSYQGTKLPFHILCEQDPTYQRPAIWIANNLALPN